ncbi:MAG: leucyl/phenylalanyl-tRNA--protein transferase [Bergeyella sp.]
MVFRLNPDEITFPNPEFYQGEGGVIAFGGDLSPERIWFAYQNGIFPWFNPGEEILWWFPDPRFVLFPEKLKVSKSMKKILKNQEFTFTENQCFREVMENCRNVERKGQDGTWISDEMIDSYEVLHKSGKAKSVEVWKDGILVGGLYGVEVGRVFCGESMFAKVSNASKAGFIDFVLRNQNNYALIDCQSYTEHLESLGAEMISPHEFLTLLKQYRHES